MRVKVGLAQIYPKVGDVKANLQKHLDLIQQASQQGVDLIVFPELSMTGYQGLNFAAMAAAVGALLLRRWIAALDGLVVCPVAVLFVLASTCAFY